MELTKICSKCGLEKPITEFHKNGFNSKGEQKYRGYCKTCANKLETARYHKKKAFIDAQKICCEKCGDSRTYILDYHHRNPEDKEFTIGRLKKGAEQVLQNEINKCVVLCANCHREFHYLNKLTGITLDKYLNNDEDLCNGSTADFAGTDVIETYP